MRKFYFLFVAAMVSIAQQAAPVSKQQARQKAQAFMATKGMQIVNEPRRAPGMQEGDEAPFYIFNAKDKGGFVIISADDQTAEVLGYSVNGSYDEGNVPANLRDWMGDMSKMIEGARSKEQGARGEASPRFVPEHEAIAPLIKTEWDQGEPSEAGWVYNTMCPTISKIHTYTGCVATATAQIMYYYQYPKGATASIPEYTANDVLGKLKALPATTFKWEEMQLTYTGEEPQSQQDAVAELMRYCGQNAEMNYGTGGSSASITVAAQNMVKNFDYDPYSYQWVRRSDYTISEWDALIYKELAEGRPVLYSGNSSAGGHAFLCDGYDGEGLYHINWGWGGSYNGYFVLHIANPHEGQVEEDGYSVNQDAIIGLQPNTGMVPEDTPEEPEPDYGIVATTSHYTFEEGSKVTLWYQNKTEETRKFALGFGLLKDDLSIEPRIKLDYYTNSDLDPRHYFNPTIDLNDAHLSEGQYKLVAISREGGSEEWKRCAPYENWLDVTVDALGAITNIVCHPILSMNISNAKVVNCTENETVNISFDVTNTGDAYKDNIYVFLDKAGEEGDFYSEFKLNLKEGESTNVRVNGKSLKGKGNYTVRVTTDWEGEEVIATTTLEIGSKLKAEKWKVETNRMQYMEQNILLTVNNTGDEYNGSIYIFASQTSDMGAPIYRTATALEENGSETLNIPCVFAESGTYTIWACNNSDGTDFIGTTTLSIKPAPTTSATLKSINTEVEAGKTTTFSIIIKNTGDVTYYNRITVHLYKQQDDSGTYPWVTSKKSEQLTLEPGEQVSLTFTFEDMEEGKKYCLAAFYQPLMKENTIYQMENAEKWFSVPVADGIAAPTISTEDDTAAYYTLSGIRLNGKPAKAGIYIKNGKKVLVH